MVGRTWKGKFGRKGQNADGLVSNSGMERDFVESWQEENIGLSIRGKH